MAISSINSNLAALLAQTNIGNATAATSNNVAQLSSGNRIVQASSDVAALATGTTLQSQVNVLNTSLTVASQGSSLLQVADGALTQIGSILQRQQAIATQAQSGSLSDTQRGFLDQEFQNLTQEINQLAGSTNFNGVKLLNGGLSQSLTTPSVTRRLPRHPAAIPLPRTPRTMTRLRSTGRRSRLSPRQPQVTYPSLAPPVLLRRALR